MLHQPRLTATILLTEVGEPPDVAEADTEAQHGEEELDRTVPGDPSRSLPSLALHVLLHLLNLLKLNHSDSTSNQTADEISEGVGEGVLPDLDICSPEAADVCECRGPV